VQQNSRTRQMKAPAGQLRPRQGRKPIKQQGNITPIFIIGGRFDMPFLILVLSLLGIGLIVLFSASHASAYYYEGNSYYYIWRQLAFAIAGVVFMLAASFVISRETTDDTLKSILTVPVDFKKLLLGKFELLFFLSIAFSLINAAFAVIMNLLLHFPGMSAYSIMIATGRIIATNILIYLSVLPLIIINTFLFGSSLIGVAVAFVYGYFGTFEGSLLNWFPIKAAMILFDPYCGAEYDTVSYQTFPAIIILILTVLLSVVLLNAFTHSEKLPNVKAKRKPKKAERKRGW